MVNKPLIRPYFWGGTWPGGGWLTSHEFPYISVCFEVHVVDLHHTLSVSNAHVLNFAEVVLIHAMREVKKEVVLTRDFKPDALVIMSWEPKGTPHNATLPKK